MDPLKKKNLGKKRRQLRSRQKISGTTERPRLAVNRTLRNLTAQVIDDTTGNTIVSVTSIGKAFAEYGGNIAAAKALGLALAEKAKEKSIEAVVFDRGGRKYHGRIQAFADGAREGGLKF